MLMPLISLCRNLRRMNVISLSLLNHCCCYCCYCVWTNHKFCVGRTKSATKNTMHLLNGKCLAFAWCSVILLGCVEFGSGNRCSRVPERLKTERTPSTGHFRIRLSETSGRYKPGKQYTSKWKPRTKCSIQMHFTILLSWWICLADSLVGID